MTTKEEKLNRIQESNYIELVEKVANSIIKEDDQKRAFELSKIFEDIILISRDLFFNNDIYNFYKKITIRMKFVALPLLSNKDVLDLLGNYFTWQFKIIDYNLEEKFKYKIINIIVIEERDELKNQLKKILLNSSEIITGTTKIKSISEWITDYNSKLGIGRADNLKRTQYFIDLEKIPKINKRDIKKLKILFDFYEKLKLSSFDAEGFDEEIPIKIKDKLYIYRKGVLESVDFENETDKTKEKDGNTGIETKKHNDFKSGGLEDMVLEEEKILNKEIEGLKIMAGRYKVGSLERTAIEEEIKRLEKN